MSNSTTILDLISSSQAQKEVTANALFDAGSPATLFGRRASTSSALTWGYYGGAMAVSGVPTSIANGTLALTPSTTNYVEVTTAGTVSSNTSGFTTGRIKLYSIVTGASTVTSYTDLRVGTSGLGGTQSKRIASPSWSSSMTLDWDSYDVYRITLGGATTFTFSGGTDGQNCTIELLQDGTGSRTVTWPGTVRFSTDLPSPTLTTTASKMDKVGFQHNSGLTKYDCVAVVKGY